MFANLFVSQAVLGVLVGLLVAVAIIDVRHLTISNRYCAAIALLYPVYVVTAPYGVDWIDGAIVGAVALTIGFLLFSMRFAGGGDVKFFAAISLWAGSHWLAEYVFVTALVGGVLSICMLIHRRLNSKRNAPSDVGLAARGWRPPTSSWVACCWPAPAPQALWRPARSRVRPAPTAPPIRIPNPIRKASSQWGSSIRRGDLLWRDRRGRDVAHERLKP